MRSEIPPVLRASGDGPENEEVERALREVQAVDMAAFRRSVVGRRPAARGWPCRSGQGRGADRQRPMM